MKILVLAYHNVAPMYHIDPETFGWQMRILKKRYVNLSLDDVGSFLERKLELKKDGFSITFDDGYKDNLTYAYPILKKHNLRGTVFVIPKLIPPEDDKRSNQLLTWEEIKSLRPVFQVESHSHSHGHQPEMELMEPRARQRWMSFSEKDILYELENSIKEITDKTEHNPTHLAWPYGEYKKEWIPIAQKVGFKTCFTTKQGSVSFDDNPYELRRFSPPRNKLLFWIALQGKFGMNIYIVILRVFNLLKKVIQN